MIVHDDELRALVPRDAWHSAMLSNPQLVEAYMTIPSYGPRRCQLCGPKKYGVRIHRCPYRASYWTLHAPGQLVHRLYLCAHHVKRGIKFFAKEQK